MKVSIEITLQLTEQENAVLRKLLGSISSSILTQIGMTMDEASMVSSIWQELPYTEED